MTPITSSVFSTRPMCRWWKIRSYRLWIPSRLFCASTDSIRRIGCCGSTAFAPASCSTKASRTLTRCSIPSAAGRCGTPTSSRSRSTARDYEALLRVPGIGVVSAKRILVARRGGALRAEDLKKLGVVLKRAQYFSHLLWPKHRTAAALARGVRRNLTATERASLSAGPLDQLSLFEPA